MLRAGARLRCPMMPARSLGGESGSLAVRRSTNCCREALKRIRFTKSRERPPPLAAPLPGIGWRQSALRRVSRCAGSMRFPGCGVSSVPSRTAHPWVLWCWPKALAGEFGLPSAAGFAHLGLDPSRLLIIETARASEALNALEESLKASSLAVVIGVLNEIELTPARRLEPCGRRNGNTLPSRHASIVRAHRRDGDPLACGARAKCGASLRSSCPGCGARLGHHRALPRQARKRCPAFPASGVV